MNLNIKHVVGNFDYKNDSMMKIYFLLSLLVLAIVTQSFAHAGTDNTFGDIVTWLENQLDGSYGKGIAIASVLIGAVAALRTRDLMFLGYGVGLAVGLIYIPDIIGGFFSATLAI